MMDRSPNNYNENSEGSDSSENPSVLIYVKLTGELVSLFLYSLWILVLRVFRLIFPSEPKSLSGEVVLVTGGANGIGRGICQELAKVEHNLTLIIWDLDEIKAKETAKELVDFGVKKVEWARVDVSDFQQVENAARNIRERIGDVTMLFNNAGMAGQVGEGWLMDPKTVEKVFQVNCISHCWTLKEFLPSMITRGKGHVIETCSMLGVMPGAPHGSPYVASKHALKAYIECIKEDVRLLPERPDIKFTTVYPNLTTTAMTKPVNLSFKKYPFLLPAEGPATVAATIVKGVLRNQEHIFFPSYGGIAPAFLALTPTKVLNRMADIVQFNHNKSF